MTPLIGAPGIAVVPVRTPTLPPATHTNSYVVGDGRMSVFDPASPYDDEQRHLAAELDERLDAGEQVERIVLTHHHGDHVSGAEALRAHLRTRGRDVPIEAHEVTADLVADRIAVDRRIGDGERLDCGGRTLVARFTPGHAPGHLVFDDAASGAVIAGDMVAGVGTILIDPHDGDLALYLASLEAMKARSPATLLPAHGPALAHAEAVLAFYVAHRHERTAQIAHALDRLGAASAPELAPHVYRDLPPEVWKIGAVQITAHLLWMARNGLARELGPGRWTR
jgi:glyoxylase-like metal-dependent hydrolase (beta-lactamase superfamily II)